MTVRISNASGAAARGSLVLDAEDYHADESADPPLLESAFECGPGADATVSVDYPLGVDARLWDEFDPALYRLTIVLTASAGTARFADRIGVNVNTVYRWAREVGASSAPAVSQRVVPVRVVSDSPSAAAPVDIEIGLRNGRTLRIRHALDTDLLLRLADALES